MRTFSYIAYTNEGHRRTGIIVAEDASAASEKLRGQGLFPEDLSDRGIPANSSGNRRSRLDADLQAVFTRQMAVLLSAGLPVDAALEVVRSSGASKRMELVAARTKALVLDGAPLSEALEQAGSGLPGYVTSAIRAGEASRDVVAVFETIADHLESRGTERSQLAAALIYPAFVATVSCLVCGILMVTVAPELATMFEATGRPLPTLTRVMLSTSQWLQKNFALLLGILLGAVVCIPIALRIPAVRNWWHGVLLRIPIARRLMTLEAAAQYLRTLALVVASRQPVVEGVESASRLLHVRKFREEAERAIASVRAGAPLSAALGETSFVPPVARQLVQAGEESARLGRMTERAAVLVEAWLRDYRKRLSTFLDPALMMLVGAFVLVIVLAVLLPIFDLQSAISL